MTQIDPPSQARPEGLWIPSRVRRLVGLWNERISAGRIAEALGEGVTRSAVVGKLNRMGLRRSDEQRQEAQAAGARRARRRNLPPSLPFIPLPEPTPIAAAPRLVELTALSHACCRWPYEVDGATRFCGLKVEPGGPYCPDHRGVAYCGRLPPLTLETLGLSSSRNKS